MNLNVEWFRFGWDVLWSLGTLISIYMAWMNRRASSSKEALNLVEERFDTALKEERIAGNRRDEHVGRSLGDVRNRLTTLEEAIKHLPTVSDVGSLRDAVGLLATQIAELKGAQAGTGRMVERMNEYLLRKGD